jgi:DnaJ-class molecular chaperone
MMALDPEFTDNYVACPVCDGTGCYDGEDGAPLICNHCDGTGMVKTDDDGERNPHGA